MGQISDIRNPWRDLLKSPASFRGVAFYVEQSARAGGRRTVVHEYPKRNDPYGEDMGRHAARFQFSGYLIYSPSPKPGFASYVQQRRDLIAALDQDDVGELRHPVLGNWQVICERYSMIETRQRGGYTEFDMSFVQSGSPGNSIISISTSGNVVEVASALENLSISTLGQVITRVLNF